MLSAEDFFAVCAGHWQTDRTYYYPQKGQLGRSHTEFNAEILTLVEKHQISSSFIPPEFFKDMPSEILLVGFGLECCEG